MTTARDLHRILDEHASEQLDVGSTRAAPPPQVWDARAERIARRSIDGVDHDPEPRPPSFDSFIAAMAASEDWGVPVRSSSDPDRFGKGAMGGGGGNLPTNRHDERERYALAERELGRVSEALPPHHTRCGHTLDGVMQLAIWQAVRGAGKATRRIIKGGAPARRGKPGKALAAPTTRVVTVPDRQRRTASEVAELLAEHRVEMSDQEIGSLCARITKRVRAAFEAKGWVRASMAPKNGREHAQSRGEAEEMAKADWCTGWGEIAAHLGCSVRTAQKLEAIGLPVRKGLSGGVSAKKAELDDYCERARAPREKGAA